MGRHPPGQLSRKRSFAMSKTTKRENTEFAPSKKSAPEGGAHHCDLESFSDSLPMLDIELPMLDIELPDLFNDPLPDLADFPKL